MSYQTKLKQHAVPLTMLLAACVLFAVPELASAQSSQGIGKVAGNVSTEIQGVIPLINSVAYVVGAALCIIALFMFKKNRDDPRDTPLSKPLWTLVVAVGFLFFPTVVGIGAKTLFGSDGTAVEANSKTFNIPK